MAEERDSREEQRPPRGRYSLFVGLAFIALIVVAALNTIRANDSGILGTDVVADRGMALAEFAVPDLRGEQVGDANVYQDDCASSENPCPASDRRTPACEVELVQVIRVCDLFDRPLVISFWFTGGADCLPTQDVVDRIARRFSGQVNFLSIDVRDDREEARQIVEDRGWTIPVGYDADGAVSNLYLVGVCPTVAFAYPGGILSEAKLGELSERQLVADVSRLIERSARRARVSR